MSEQNARTASKREWTVGSFYEAPTLAGINMGSFQRIADACELMAKNHATLIEDKEMYERWYREGRDANAKLQRRVAAYKGVITRLKARNGGSR